MSRALSPVQAVWLAAQREDARLGVRGGLVAARVAGAALWPPQRLVGDQQPLLAHLSPAGGLGLILTKVTVLSLSGRLRTVQKRIEELEEEDEEAIMQIELADVLAPSRHKHELSVWKGFGRNLRIGVLRDLAILTVQRLYELATMRWLVGERMARSIVKNAPRSAVRKAERRSAAAVDPGPAAFMGQVFVSSLKGQLMFWLALFSVNQGVDTYLTLSERKGAGGGDLGEAFPRGQESYARRLALNAARCSGGCVLAAAGAALGSAVKPGIGTMLGITIAPNFIYLLV